MGTHLNRAKAHFGTDTRGLLDGGRYALLHTRTMEFDDLRPYVPGDDVRDIDWKATARSEAVLIRRFVSEKHHKILLVADAGANMSALAPSGEVKRDIAAHVMGAIGLIALRRSDQLALTYGDARASATVPARRGETHVEALIDRFLRHAHGAAGPSDIVAQLLDVATAHRRRMLIVVVSDEPDVDDRLAAALTQLTGRHELIWAMISDMPAAGAGDADVDGYDVSSGRFVINSTELGPRVIAAYRAAEARRLARLEDFATEHGLRYTRIGGTSQLRAKLVELTGDYRHAG